MHQNKIISDLELTRFRKCKISNHQLFTDMVASKTKISYHGSISDDHGKKSSGHTQDVKKRQRHKSTIRVQYVVGVNQYVRGKAGKGYLKEKRNTRKII